MRLFFLLVVPIFLYGDSLLSLLHFAKEHNEELVSKKLLQHSKESALKSVRNSYYPRVNVGGFYKRSDEPSPFLPGTTYSAYADVTLDVYGGGEKHYTKAQKSDELFSSKYDYEAAKKDMSLSIVQAFYNIKNSEAKVKALQDSLTAVKAQLTRVERYFDAKLATEDAVETLQAAYDKNAYLLESAKFVLLSHKRKLELQVGKKIEHFEASAFIKKEDGAENLDAIESLRYKQSALYNAAKAIESYYAYQDEPSFGGLPIPLLERQNVVMATVFMNLFDFSTVSEKKKSVQLRADAMAHQIAYKTKEQAVQRELAQSRIESAKLNIKSAKSALVASQSALKTITQKYQNSIVDNVVYLNALASQTEAKATYAVAENNLEIAYALYYYYSGKKLEEFLNE